MNESMNAGDLVNLATVILFCGMMAMVTIAAWMGTRALVKAVN